MKFTLQIHEVEVVVPAGTLGPVVMEAQIAGLIQRYEAIYGQGSAFTGAGVQIGVLRVFGRGRLRAPALPKLEGVTGTPAVGRRRVYWEAGGFLDTAIYDSSSLQRGVELTGPAIVELSVTTIVLQPG